MSNNLLNAFELMLKGMSGIMLVSVIIAIIVGILGKVDGKANSTKES